MQRLRKTFSTSGAEEVLVSKNGATGMVLTCFR